MNTQKTHWLRFTIIVLIVCAIGGGALAAALYSRKAEKIYVSANLQLSFEGAAQGLAPNGSRYDLNDIMTDELLDAALQAAGLSGQCTAEQVRACMVIRGVYPKDVVEQLLDYESVLDFKANRTLNIRVYYPTQYTIMLYGDMDAGLSRSQLESLLTEIMKAYTEYFCRVYAFGVNPVALEFDIEDFDYSQMLDVLSDSVKRSATYAQMLYDREPTLRYNGMGFNDIYVRFRNLIDSDIARLNSTIVMNGLAKSPERLVIQYQYLIKDMQNQLEKQKTRLSRLDALIGTYEKNKVFYFATTDQVTRIDDNSSDTYDEMVSARKALADEITGIQTKIDVYEMRVNDLVEEVATAPLADEDAAEAADNAVVHVQSTTVPRASAEQTAALEGQIQTVLAKRESIMRDFAALVTAYNAQALNDQTVTASDVRYSAPSLLSGAFVKLYIKTAGPICAVGFMFCLVLIIISRLGEGKKKRRKKPAASSR